MALIAAYGNPDTSFWEFDADGNMQYKAVETTVDGQTIYTPANQEDWMFADVVNGYPAIDLAWRVKNPAITFVKGSRDELSTNEEYLALIPTKQYSQRIVSAEMMQDRTDIEMELFDYVENFVAESVVYGLDDAKWEKHIQQLADLGYDEWIQWYQDVEDGNVY